MPPSRGLPEASRYAGGASLFRRTKVRRNDRNFVATKQMESCYDTITTQNLEKTMTTISIKGMSCQHCVASTKKALEEVPGISNVDVNLEKGEASYDGEVAIDVVKEAITRIGFEPGS